MSENKKQTNLNTKKKPTTISKEFLNFKLNFVR